MPDGVVEWFDDETDEGRILRGGRRYTVHGSDIEPRACWPGARVRFDIDRSAGDVARSVRVRPGRRSSRHHGRAGDRSGRHGADQRSGPAGARPAREPLLGAETRPGEVARRWAAAIGTRRLDDAMRMYAPHAVAHADGDIAVGPDMIRDVLAASQLVGDTPVVTDDSGDGRVELRWDPASGIRGPGTRLVVEHGEIAEQWVGDIGAATVRNGRDETLVSVSSSGQVDDRAWNHAVDRLERVVERIGAPVLRASVRLAQSADPARTRGASVSATVDVDGWPVRARADEATMFDAVDRVTERLRDRLDHLDQRRIALRRRGAERTAGEWRHGDRPDAHRSRVSLPAGERALVRRKSFAVEGSTVDEAIVDMESLGHDFLLFNDAISGGDAVVSRHGDRYRVRFADGRPESAPVVSVADVEVDPNPAAVGTIDVARAELDLSGEPWVFFREPSSDRARVVYRRDDGHDGLITLTDPV